MEKLEIVRKDVSPLSLKIVSILIFTATAYKVITLTFFDINPFIYIVLNAIAVGIWTAKEIIIIDFGKRLIGEGIRVFGMTYVTNNKFSGFEKVFINKIKLTETFRPLTRTIDIHHEAYKAFLKTHEGHKFCIGDSTDKDDLIKKLKKYNEKLNTEIFDNTFYEPIKVN
jgi:hypothetical protein